MRKDGKITDEEIHKEYKKGDLMEITGKSGTILAVDTSGFHKGKNLTQGDRLLLQFEYTNSLFGVKNTFHTVQTPHQDFLLAKREFPHILQRYSLANNQPL